MKKRFCLFVVMVFLGWQFTGITEARAGNNPTNEGTLKVYSTPGLYELTMKWVNEFTKANQKTKIIITQEMNSPDVQNKYKGIIITDDESLITHNQSGINLIAGRDIFVPVMNSQNPAKARIVREGITPKSLEIQAKSGNGMFVKCFAANDASVIKGVEKFMNSSDLKVKGIETAGEKEVIDFVRKNPGAIGFVRLNSIKEQGGQGLTENIELVPVDKNGNGKIDYMEEIFDNLQSFERGVWIGKYPKALSGRIYAVSAEQPYGGNETAFLTWILTDGQQFLSSSGFNELVPNERQAQLAKIAPVPVTPPAAGKPLSPIRWIVTILLISGAILLVRNAALKRNRKGKKSMLSTLTGQMRVFDENSSIIPGGLFFDRTHTWTFMKKDGTVKVGIDDFLQHVTGKITRIELKKTGDKIMKGEHLFTIVQKGKQLDIYSPVTGIIREKNGSLIENPSLINTSPYNEGWIYCIEPKNWPVEIQFLNMAEKYKAELKKEFQRLKDFLVSALKTDEPEYAMVLQDGGALKDNILEELGPEVWDDFQTKFIDAAMC